MHTDRYDVGAPLLVVEGLCGRDLPRNIVDGEAPGSPAHLVVRDAFCGGRHRSAHRGALRLVLVDGARDRGIRILHGALDEPEPLLRIDAQAVARPRSRSARSSRRRDRRVECDVEHLDRLGLVVLDRLDADRLRALARLEDDAALHPLIVGARQRRAVAGSPPYRHPLGHRRGQRDHRIPRRALGQRVVHRRDLYRHCTQVGDRRRRRGGIHHHRTRTARASQRQHHRLAVVQDVVVERGERDPRGVLPLGHRDLARQRAVIRARCGRARHRVANGHRPVRGAARHRDLEAALRALGHHAALGRGERHAQSVGDGGRSGRARRGCGRAGGTGEQEGGERKNGKRSNGGTRGKGAIGGARAHGCQGGRLGGKAHRWRTSCGGEVGG